MRVAKFKKARAAAKKHMFFSHCFINDLSRKTNAKLRRNLGNLQCAQTSTKKSAVGMHFWRKKNLILVDFYCPLDSREPPKTSRERPRILPFFHWFLVGSENRPGAAAGRPQGAPGPPQAPPAYHFRWIFNRFLGSISTRTLSEILSVGSEMRDEILLEISQNLVEVAKK